MKATTDLRAHMAASTLWLPAEHCDYGSRACVAGVRCVARVRLYDDDLNNVSGDLRSGLLDVAGDHHRRLARDSRWRP